MSIKNKLRVGVLLDSLILPLWKYKTLEKVFNSDFAEVSLLLNRSIIKSPKRKKSILSSYSLTSLYEKSDRFFFRGKPDFAINKDASGLKNVTKLDLKCSKGVSTTGLTDEEINKISKYNLDVLINFESTDSDKDFNGLSKYGIWSFYLIDDWMIKGTVAGFWELALKCTGYGFGEQPIIKDSNEGIFIYRIVEATDNLSLNLNKNKLFWRGSLLIPRILKGIYNDGDNFFNHLIIKYNIPENESAGLPSLTPNSGSFFSNIGNRIGYKLFFTGNLKWFLFYGDGHNNYLPPFKGLKKLAPPSNDRFWADPFPVNSNSKNYVFVEELFYKKNKGHISLIELGNDGKPSAIKRILEKPYHISFPFIFHTGDDYYMIPETSANRTIDIYKCSDFPDKWVFMKSIMKDVRAVDTLIFYYADKWWLFTSIDETDGLSGCSTELFLFFNKDLFSDDWKGHPQNPIITDVRTARSAGKIFVQNGKIYRPSQDCSGRYGRAINISQILTLSETRYLETHVGRIIPDWDQDIKGTHTYNIDNDFMVTDAYSFRRRTLKHIK